MASVYVIKETRLYNDPNDWDLAFQYCNYCYDDGSNEFGYRFIWVDSEGKLRPSRGQARIPSTSDILTLVAKSIAEGWGHPDWDKNQTEQQ